MIGFLFIHVIIYTTCRVIVEAGIEYNTATKVFLVLALVIKLISDSLVFWIFTQVFRFFLNKKRSGLKKDALRLSPLNYFIIATVCFMFFMRVLGTLFNTQNGIVSLDDSIYNT
jgi:hypothetical protein